MRKTNSVLGSFYDSFTMMRVGDTAAMPAKYAFMFTVFSNGLEMWAIALLNCYFLSWKVNSYLL